MHVEVQITEINTKFAKHDWAREAGAVLRMLGSQIIQWSDDVTVG